MELLLWFRLIARRIREWTRRETTSEEQKMRARFTRLFHDDPLTAWLLQDA